MSNNIFSPKIAIWLINIEGGTLNNTKTSSHNVRMYNTNYHKHIVYTQSNTFVHNTNNLANVKNNMQHIYNIVQTLNYACLHDVYTFVRYAKKMYKHSNK